MRLRRKQIASGRVGNDEWRVEFARVAGNGVWEFEAYRTGEAATGRPNVFWSQPKRRFVAATRLDVPGAMLERIVVWSERAAAEPEAHVR